MRRVTPFRIAAVLLIIFCAGHTAGGMLAQDSLGTDADAVFAQMKAVHFAFQGSDCTWYGFWFGFGMTTSLFLLLSAIIAWQLEKVPPAAWSAVSVIAYSLVAVHAVNTFLSWKYFFIGPAVFSAVVTALLAWGTSRKKSTG
jgi:hypothetical protein